jgi:hypothetical protein
MVLRLQIAFDDVQSLAEQLAVHRKQGALLIKSAAPLDGVTQYAELELTLSVGDRRCTLSGEVIQILPDQGLVARLGSLAPAQALLDGTSSAEKSESLDLPADGERTGTTVLSWTVEKLQRAWDQLTLADKIRLAKYGDKAARGVILRGQDRSLHFHLLLNNKIAAEEIAAIAALPGQDPNILRRIISNQEWLKHTSVVRSLVCNPRLSIPQVRQLLRYLPADEQRRLAKAGRVRAAIKREIIRNLDRGGS